MCPYHWERLPQHHKDEIRRLYVRGQERNIRLVTGAYLVAQAKAVLAMGVIDNVDYQLVKRQRAWLDTLERKHGAKTA